MSNPNRNPKSNPNPTPNPTQVMHGRVCMGAYGRRGGDDEPAVHLTWREARDYCASVGGRLPTLDEWTRAAYTQTRTPPGDGYVVGRTYPYPVGDDPE